MHHRSWVDTYSDLLPPGWFDEHGPRERIDRWRRVLATPLPPGARRTGVFDADGGAVAWCVVGPARTHDAVAPVRDLELWGLYVDREQLGSGLGQDLLDWAVGHDPAELWRARGNERAAAFYRRNGFVDDGRELAPGTPPIVEVRMVR